ncbi:Sulfite oxidase [Colletotrichum orbiculare MAFF 240422]|uniref:Sulfite oxidase n=1 Tax=Colletotrichum orbiculare (strain 104-T / ATCC 96160 / CBS 514.97 / LARS 414 / MAFF 240422) TaxID=1213857 RepID=A0A484FL36_COLOR|nr:Sulfite oxidase [Colletotrichum orbiculare MAFF 240422]
MTAPDSTQPSGTHHIHPLPLNEKPLNREPPAADLTASLFSGDNAYDRNHGMIPTIDRDAHRVVVDGEIGKTLCLTVDELATNFAQHEVVCVLQCAGNRRHTMRTLLKEVDGIDWGDAAIMNCSWRGPKLRDILDAAGVAHNPEAHVAFSCYQSETEKDSWYGASIELERAMDENREIILALERNSKHLSPNHGAPVRVIIPGVAGARSVKWLDRITVQKMESSNFYQKRDYKVLPEEVNNAEEAEAHWDTTPALQDMPVNSVIVHPPSGSSVCRDDDGLVQVAGYAVPGGPDGPITEVGVSVDGGQTWTQADLQSVSTVLVPIRRSSVDNLSISICPYHIRG